MSESLVSLSDNHATRFQRDRTGRHRDCAHYCKTPGHARRPNSSASRLAHGLDRSSLLRDCVNQLFEASSASQVTLDADFQRYFRDANVLHQHGFLQPNTSNELYGRVLAGIEPNTTFY